MLRVIEEEFAHFSAVARDDRGEDGAEVGQVGGVEGGDDAGVQDDQVEEGVGVRVAADEVVAGVEVAVDKIVTEHLKLNVVSRFEITITSQ